MTIWKADIQRDGGALYLQLADAIEADVALGILAPGTKLPTHRELADVLNMNVTTVTRGYKEAQRRGLIAGTVGRGTYISSDIGVQRSMVSDLQESSGGIEMGLINPLYDLDPDLGAALKKLCRHKDVSSLLHYSDPGGLLEHRSIGAQWTKRFGIEVNQEDIIVCSGGQHALTCILNGLFQPGDRIATDSLTYPGFKNLAAMRGLRLVPVEMDAQGMSSEALDRVCRRERVRGLYLMPGVHNPTTVMLSASRRDALAEVVAKHNLLVIEDDAYDLTRPYATYPVKQLLPGHSIYIAGVSKALAPGLRVGFMAVPRIHCRGIREAVLNTVWMTSPLNVELVRQWIADGTADRVMEAKRCEAAKRTALAAEILGDLVYEKIETGFFIWLCLPPPWQGVDFELRMRNHGVNIFGAEKFVVGDAPVPAAARISLTGARSLKELAHGLRLIKSVLDGGLGVDSQVTM